MVIGGLGLFLFALNHISSTLKEILDTKAQRFLDKFTGNIFTAILSGIIITVILDSSSAVIIMTIILVNTGALTFRQAMGIVLGANIGTTFSSQIIALDIGKFSPIPIFIGLVLSMISKSEKISNTGKVILYFGILFFGLYTMERAVEPLKNHSRFAEWMLQLESPLKGVLTGTLATLIVQSSSATVGMVITLAKKGLISLAAAIAVMLGSELGTCADTLLATIKSNRQALRTGVFHLLFNIICISLGLLLFPFFVNFITRISGRAQLEQQVANAHMLFNIAGVLIFLPFIGMIEKWVITIIPDKKPRVSFTNSVPDQA